MVATLVRMTLRAAAVTVLAGLLLTACSSEEAPDGGASSTPSPSASSEPTEETAVEKTSVVVPDVVGMDGASALAELEAVGLGAAGFWQNAEVTPDGQLDVSAQEPRAGETILAGDDVVLALDVPQIPATWGKRTDSVVELWIGSDVDKQQVGWIVTELMDPDQAPWSLDILEGELPAGSYSVVLRCGAPSPEETVVAEATFSVDAAEPTASRPTADLITMVDGASCG